METGYCLASSALSRASFLVARYAARVLPARIDLGDDAVVHLLARQQHRRGAVRFVVASQLEILAETPRVGFAVFVNGVRARTTRGHVGDVFEIQLLQRVGFGGHASVTFYDAELAGIAAANGVDVSTCVKAYGMMLASGNLLNCATLEKITRLCFIFH